MKNVYFMRPVGLAGPIKIGCSAQPVKRLLSVELWSPLKLELAAHAPGGNNHERILHYRFGEHRLHGEWFEENQELNALIEQVARTGVLPLMDIPTGPAEWREVESKSIRRQRREPGMHRAKCILTNRITAAEKHAFGYGAIENRPDEIAEIVASYHGFFTSLPGAAEMALVEEYCARLLAMPKVVRNWDNWRAWSDARAAGRAA